MTGIPRLSSSNTERVPPKFRHELDSFGEERLSEKRRARLCWQGHSCPRAAERRLSRQPVPTARGRGRPRHTGIILAHHGSMFRPDFIHHANLSRLRVRIFVDSQVLLRQFVDVLVRAVLGNLNHGAAYLQITIGIVGIDDGQRHPRIAAHVAVLLPAARRIKDHMLAVEVAPHGSDLRASVGHQRAEIGESALLEKVDIFFRNHVGHRWVSPVLIYGRPDYRCWKWNDGAVKWYT